MIARSYWLPVALLLIFVAPLGAVELDGARLDAFLETARQRAGTPALSAAVVLDGKLVYSGGAGYADLEHQVPATADSVYRIGSISKPIGRPITVREILTHTSGIRHYKGGEMLHARRHDTLASAIEIFKDDPLRFEPGEKFSYSSYAFNLLQGVVEKAAGQPFDAYLREHVWQPAGMQSTYFDYAEKLIPPVRGATSGRPRGATRRSPTPLTST